MLDDIPATRPQIARHLGISNRTLLRYVKENQAPRPVMLSLFWETRWGRSAADCEASNYMAINYRLLKGLERANASLLAQVATLELLCSRGPSGAANQVFYRSG
jgi:hypothetical protein